MVFLGDTLVVRQKDFGTGFTLFQTSQRLDRYSIRRVRDLDGIKILAERARTKKRRLRGLRRLWVGDQDLEGNCPHDSHPTILATLGSQLNSEHRQLLILG